MNYKHLGQFERYQIYSLMNANQSITQIAEQLGLHKSTISREIGCNKGCRGYRPNQACELALARFQGSRNAREVKPWVMCQADEPLGLQWSPEQIAGKLPVSHETLYLHVYADKANGGKLWRSLRCQKQNRKRYAGGQYRRGQIPNRRLLSERPAHIEDRKQVGHWEGDTVIGANHKQSIVTVVDRKSGYAVIAKVENKTADLVGAAIVDRLKPFGTKVKTLTFDNEKSSADTARLTKHWAALVTLQGPLPAGS
jgi:IS30 family transposase